MESNNTRYNLAPRTLIIKINKLIPFSTTKRAMIGMVARHKQ